MLTRRGTMTDETTGTGRCPVKDIKNLTGVPVESKGIKPSVPSQKVKPRIKPKSSKSSEFSFNFSLFSKSSKFESKVLKFTG
jgi:hypothetical protein